MRSSWLSAVRKSRVSRAAMPIALDAWYGDLTPRDLGEAPLNFQPAGKVKLFPKGCSKWMLNIIALISHFETQQVL
jgi:hypothetical protein